MILTDDLVDAYGDKLQGIVARIEEYIGEHGLDIPSDAILEVCIDGVMLLVDEQEVLGMGVRGEIDSPVEETPLAKKYKSAA